MSGSLDKTAELWLEIDQLHLSYLQHEESPPKVCLNLIICILRYLQKIPVPCARQCSGSYMQEFSLPVPILSNADPELGAFCILLWYRYPVPVQKILLRLGKKLRKICILVLNLSAITVPVTAPLMKKFLLIVK
jgi:hypothetical protein